MSVAEVLEKLSRDASRSNLICFCGAGVSKEAPTNLPTADEIVCDLLAEVGQALPDLQHDLLGGSHLFRDRPFELFMAVVEQGLLFRVFELLKPLTTGRTNSFHAYLASLLAKRKIAHLFTTNFDYMFECALGKDLSKIDVLYGWQEIDRLQKRSHQPYLVKLHGSILGNNREDTTRQTILTTMDRIYQTSTQSLLKQWAGVLNGKTVLFLGYSGRDRLDVMRLLQLLDRSSLVWVNHTDSTQLRIDDLSSALSPELKALVVGGGPSVTIVSGNTKRFLTEFGRAVKVGFPPSAFRATDCEARPMSFQSAFMAPLFPKYAGLAAGYLFLWAGWSRQAALGFGNFVQNHSDGEAHLAANAFAGLGQAFEHLDDIEAAEKFYRIAIRGYWGFGDYHRIVRTQNMLGKFLCKQGQTDEGLRLIEHSLELAERESHDLGAGLSRFNLAQIDEERGDVGAATSQYRKTAEIAARFGDYWLEAGALQGVIRSELRSHKKCSDETLAHGMKVLENIYWLGAGSAPSLNVADQVDPFEAVSSLVEAAVLTKGSTARSFAESNELLDLIHLKGEIVQKIRLRQQSR